MNKISEINEEGEFSFPLHYADKNNKGEILYLYGGYHSYGCGAPSWGSINENDCLYIGDKVGNIAITYIGGIVDRIPLIIGYTAWIKEMWSMAKAPFDVEEEMKEILIGSLFLEGAYECKDEVFLKIRIRNIPVESITVENLDKVGTVVFTKGCLLKKDSMEEHTIDSQNPEPDYTLLERMRKRLYTFEEDFNCVEPLSSPSKIVFCGDSYADILTHVFHDNIEDIISKCENNGMINESTKNAPTWLYNGFGTWINNKGSYHNLMFSRNHRGITSLSCLDLLSNAKKTVEYDNDMLMYFKRNNLTIRGQEVPGHWCVLINNPLYYSDVLTKVGWPTKYTKEEFQDEYMNFGNSEPDGHGLTMIAIANVWENSNSPVKWVNDNWEYVCEAVRYIDWSLKNKDISFSEHNLIYGESEGGMMTFTMYNNIPCYLGLNMYIAMAEKAKKYEIAKEWRVLSDTMEKAILSYFVKDDKWDLSKVGFFHDPSLTTYSDVVGYDVKNDVPDSWYKLSENTYNDDLNAYIGDTYLGVRGLGYDHNIITQTSLLLDKTYEYCSFVKNLAKLCYSPRLPNPFIVPECASYSKKQSLYRRLGDVGNYAQVSETIRTILMVVGVSKAKDNVVKILPRLPKHWSVNVNELTVPGTDAKISFEAKYPEDNKQLIRFCFKNKANIDTVMLRAGPFSTDKININGKLFKAKKIGDSYWAWCVFSGILENAEYIMRSEQSDIT